MDPERWRQIEDLYNSALQVEPERRAAFLDNACPSDPDLKQEVESLLSQSLSSSHSPIDRPVWEHRADLDVEAETSPLPVGLQVGPYRIEGPIGAGGMGVVYKALDTKLNRPVAIKVLSDAFANVTSRRRFQLEARMASSLNHPHIVAIYDVGEFAGRQYLVTEFIDGVTLHEWARAETRHWHEVLELLIGVADALAIAHAAGILHRDVKPSNILVAKSGYAKLADFGLAKFQDPSDRGAPKAFDGLTRPGMIIGSVAYMSPEQASARPLDARSDIFSFGAVLYELLAGKPPFRGETDLAVLDAIARAAPDPLSDRIPSPLRSIVEKALEKDVVQRYQSIRDVIRDLKGVIHASRQLTNTRRARGLRGWPLLIPAIAAVTVMGFAILWQLRRTDFFWQNPLAAARTERLTDFEGEETDGAISADGKFMVFLGDRGGRFDVWVNQIGSTDFVNVTRGKMPATPAQFIRRVGFSGDSSQIWISEGTGAGPYTLWAASVLGGEPHRFLADAMEPVWSPDGHAIAYHTSDPGDPIFIADRSGRNPKRFVCGDPEIHCHHLTWSPDGRFLYFVKGLPATDEMDIWRIPVSGDGPVRPERITTHNARVRYLAWLDARTLIYSATAENGSSQWLYTLDTGRRIPHRVSSGIAEQYLSISASNTQPRRLIASVATPVANLWTVPVSDRTQTEGDVSPFPLPNTRAVAPRVASDYVLFLSSRGDADGLWKLKDGATSELWKGSDGGVVAAPAISRNGTQICFTAREQGKSHLYLMDAEGTNIRRLTESFDVRGAPSWSSDGKWVVVAGNDGDGTYTFKVPVDGGPPVRLVDSASYNPVWSPDGRLIVYSAPLQGGTFLIKAVTPDKVAVPIPDIPVLYEMSTPYQFTADGDALIFVKPAVRVNFYIVDLKTGHQRQLTDFKTGSQTRSFDVTPDGNIIFDRYRQNSDLALIEWVR
jgi:Tol biopolymer transport system component/predicted Ser/Thr protein kinase